MPVMPTHVQAYPVVYSPVPIISTSVRVPALSPAGVPAAPPAPAPVSPPMAFTGAVLDAPAPAPPAPLAELSIETLQRLRACARSSQRARGVDCGFKYVFMGIHQIQNPSWRARTLNSLPLASLSTASSACLLRVRVACGWLVHAHVPDCELAPNCRAVP